MGVKVREKPKGSGVWWIFINHHGRRKSKKVGSKKNALEAAQKIEAKLTLKEFDIKDSEDKVTPLFKDYAKEWLAVQVKPNTRTTTYNRYISMLDLHVNKHIGNIRIDEIKRVDVIGVLRAIQKKRLSRSTLELARTVISGVSEFAIDSELIAYNPCAGILKKFGKSHSKSVGEVDVFLSEDISIILNKCREFRPDFYHYFLTAFRTGARMGEILALEWQDINWKRNYLIVRKSFRKGKVTPPKNGKSRRIDMSDQLAKELRSLYLERKKEALREGLGEPVSIIFHTAGNHTSQNSVRNVWRKLLSKCELDYRKFHTVRHSFASLLINNGESLAYIKELMGHSSIRITVDVYGHMIPSANRKALNALDESAPNRTLSAPLKTKKAVTN